MSRPEESICPRCAQNMDAQHMGKDKDGKLIIVYVCHGCNPVQSGAADHYWQCLGFLCAPKRRGSW